MSLSSSDRPSTVGARVAAALLASIGVALALGVVARSAAPRPGPSFAAAKQYAIGGDPTAVAVGDLNGGGKPDLVTLSESGTLSVLLNRGNGSFQARHDYAATGSAVITIADLNGDGKPDLATTSFVDAIVSVLLNRGDGSFQARHDYSTGSRRGTGALAVGDLNGDGKPDLVTLNNDADVDVVFTVSVLLNRGDGSFGPSRDYQTGRGAEALVIADLNGDGKPDLVAANAGEDTLSVLINRGDGSFGPSRDYPTGDGPEALVIADLNGDGKPDLVAANFFGDTVSVLLNLGAGSFAAKRDYRVGLHFAPTSIAVGDLNADGKPDLVAAKLADGSVSVLLNHGDGSFERRRDYPAGPEPLAVSIVDLNGDGKPDLAAKNQTGNAVSILVNHGDARFEPRRAYSAAGPGVIADLNSDGRPDLVSAFRDHKGSTISVRINKPGLCNVQSVIGKPLADAKLTLARVNCRPGKVQRAYSRLKKGRVISQKPKFGAVRHGGAKVNLVLSRGRRK